MRRNRLRIDRREKMLRLCVDAEELIGKLRREWPPAQAEAMGILFHDLRVRPDELVRSARAVEAGALPDAFDVLACGCGVPGCAGLQPFTVEADGASVTWRLAPAAEDAPELVFTFDRDNYLAEIARAVPTRRDGAAF